MKKNYIKTRHLLLSLAISISLFSLVITGYSQNVGIGVSSPTSRLDIIGTGSTLSTSSFKINNSLGTSLFFVRDDGSIGINTITPGSTLDLKGIFHISGSVAGYVGFKVPSSLGYVTYTLPSYDGAAGQVLTTDGLTNLSWTTPSGGGTGISCSTTFNTDYTVRGNGSGTWQCTDAMKISSSGYVSVNTSPSSSYRFRVNGNVGIGSSPSSSYELSVDGVGHFTDYVGIGTSPSSSYGLRVYDNVGIGSSPSSSYELSVDGDSYLDGGVGIGTSAPSSGLYVGSSSNFYVPTSLSSSSGTELVISSGKINKLSSSIRYKENIEDLTFDKENFLKIRPVSFTYKKSVGGDGSKDIGVIAEEVEKLVPDLVVYEKDVVKDAAGNDMKEKDGRPVFSKTDKHPESVKYERMSIYLIKIVSDQQQEIKTLKEQVAKQDVTMKNMQEQINLLNK